MRSCRRGQAVAGPGSGPQGRLPGSISAALVRALSVSVLSTLLIAGLGLVAGAERAAADEAAVLEAAPAPAPEPILLAQDGGTTPRELEPAYPAPDPGRPGPYNDREREIWNGDYVFGITRSLVKSTIVPAGKAPLFILTVPLDVAFLPFALIGGFFG